MINYFEAENKEIMNFFAKCGNDFKSQDNKYLTYNIENEILTITNSGEGLSAYPVTIEYTVKPSDSEYDGFYQYDDCYFTKFEPNYAQKLLPCFDDPSIRSTFSVELLIPSEMAGLSNRPIETTTSENSTETRIKFKETPAMCTCLLAIFIGKFGHISKETKRGLPVFMYCEEDNEDEIDDFLNAAVFAVEWMEEKMTCQYELPILQLVSHPGLMTGVQSYGLIGLQDTTISKDLSNDMLIVMHEVSHLWFGDLVSLKWWDSAFMNEGFAQYFIYLIMNDFKSDPSFNINDKFVEGEDFHCFKYFYNQRIVIDKDEVNSKQTVLRPAIYSKGAFVLKMFSDIVGQENFFKVCRNWLSEFKNQSADVEQYISVVNKTMKKDYSVFFNTWLRSVGFPILKVEEVEENNNIVGVKVSQSSLTDTVYQFKLNISFENEGEVKQMEIMMDEKEKIIPIKFEWILVNVGMKSLYTMLYSKKLIQKLIEANKNEKNCP